MINIDREIELIINSNCVEIPYEGTEVNKGQLQDDIKELAFKVAKIYVVRALKQASEKARMTGVAYGNDKSISDYKVDKNSILNAYDLNNIK